MKPTLRFRLWGKKRGDRRTGSRLAGSLGEAVFFGTLFLLGTITLTALITSQLIDPTPEIYRPGFGFWLAILVLASLILIGGVGVLYSAAHVGVSAERRSAMVRRAAAIELLREALPSPHEYPNIPRDTELTDSPGVTLAYRLPSAGQRTAWKLGALAVLSLLLSGFASVFAVVFVNSAVVGSPDWLVMLCTVPLLVAAVWSIYHFLWELWRLSRVGPTYVEISDLPLFPGEQYEIAVSQSGRFALKSIALSLVCEEEATYLQGTDVRTETQVVSQQEVLRRENVELEAGNPLVIQAVLPIPDNAVHSFESAHNAVRWKLLVQGEPASWPAFTRCFPVIVYPSHNGNASTPDHRQMDGRPIDHGTADQSPNS